MISEKPSQPETYGWCEAESIEYRSKFTCKEEEFSSNPQWKETQTDNQRGVENSTDVVETKTLPSLKPFLFQLGDTSQEKISSAAQGKSKFLSQTKNYKLASHVNDADSYIQVTPDYVSIKNLQQLKHFIIIS